MRLYKELRVNGTITPLVSEEIALHYNRPGRAIIQVRAEEDVQGEVEFSLGWNSEDNMTVFFTGDVQRCVHVDHKQKRLFCREITARLNAEHPISLRHPTLRQVLAAYAERTGISFILPEKAYASTRVPAFYGLGSGFHGLESVGGVFDVPDYHWQAQGDGKVFVGSWEDSRWKDRPVTVPETFFSKQYVSGKGLPAVPALRPGAVVNGQRLRSVTFSGHNMHLGFAHA